MFYEYEPLRTPHRTFVNVFLIFGYSVCVVFTSNWNFYQPDDISTLRYLRLCVHFCTQRTRNLCHTTSMEWLLLQLRYTPWLYVRETEERVRLVSAPLDVHSITSTLDSRWPYVVKVRKPRRRRSKVIKALVIASCGGYSWGVYEEMIRGRVIWSRRSFVSSF